MHCYRFRVKQIVTVASHYYSVAEDHPRNFKSQHPSKRRRSSPRPPCMSTKANLATQSLHVSTVSASKPTHPLYVETNAADVMPSIYWTLITMFPCVCVRTGSVPSHGPESADHVLYLWDKILFFCWPVCMFFCLYVSLSVCLCLCANVSACLYVCLCCVSVLCVCLSVCLYVCLSVCLSPCSIFVWCYLVLFPPLCDVVMVQDNGCIPY